MDYTAGVWLWRVAPRNSFDDRRQRVSWRAAPRRTCNADYAVDSERKLQTKLNNPTNKQ
jgi:hypothetical protein